MISLGLFASNYSGFTWEAKQIPFSRYAGGLTSIAVANSGYCLATTGFGSLLGYVYKFTPGDASPTRITTAPNNSYVASCISENGVYSFIVREFNGRLYKSSDYGKTWTAKGITAVWTDCKMSSSGQKIIALGESGLYLSSNYGEDFSTNPSYPNIGYRRVNISQDGNSLLLIGTLGIAFSNDFGATWEYFSHSQAVYGDISNGGQYICFSDINNSPGGFWVSIDYGETFSNSYNADYPYRANECSISGDGTIIACAGDFSEGISAILSYDYGGIFERQNITPPTIHISLSGDARHLACTDGSSTIYFCSLTRN